MRGLAHFAINPMVQLFLLLLLVAFLLWRGKLKGARVAFALLFFLFFVYGVSPLPAYLVEQWEEDFAKRVSLDRIPGDAPIDIVVLGAGHNNAPGFTLHDRLSEPALKRILEGVRIKEKYPGARLICSGYSGTGQQSQAAALGAMALELGVPPSDTLLQPLAANTEAEARTYARRFGTRNTVVLVTSALHMRRAAHWFRYYGIDPIPAPTGHLVMIDHRRETYGWTPSLYKLKMTQKLFHEYAGMLHARWRTGGERRAEVAGATN